MKVLVTAGNTSVPIDQVREITNIFHGKTGANIALYFSAKGWDVDLLTSNPNMEKATYGITGLNVSYYHTFDDLKAMMENMITFGTYDAIIHSAAVSDYTVAGVYTEEEDSDQLEPVDSSTKIGSDFPELYLKMVPTPKLISKIRTDWGFEGKLVMFKLQVGIDDTELIDIATKSMVKNDADYIVANTLEHHNDYAYVISAIPSVSTKVDRKELPKKLFEELDV
jgi:phosphopantothenate---cysteine ligase (CTP)